MNVKVTTNNKPRDLVSWFDIPEAFRNQWLDYVDAADWTDLRFFKYGDWWYDTREFEFARGDLAQQGWAGWQTQSAFDAVVLKYAEDFEHVVVGHAVW